MKYIINFACILILIMKINESSTKCTNGDTTICQRVRCIGVASAEACKPDEVFVPYDPENCICCNYCEKTHYLDKYSTHPGGIFY